MLPQGAGVQTVEIERDTPGEGRTATEAQQRGHLHRGHDQQAQDAHVPVDQQLRRAVGQIPEQVRGVEREQEPERVFERKSGRAEQESGRAQKSAR